MMNFTLSKQQIREIALEVYHDIEEIKLSSYNLEQTMFDILNRAVKQYRLSYTECNFEVVNGKIIKTE